MLTSRQKQMLQEIPKAENHIHIEGSIPWALALELAEKNHVKLPVPSTEEIAVWSQDLISRKGLDGFMICDRTLNSVCLHEEDYEAVGLALAIEEQRQNIIYQELHLDYPLNEERGIPLKVVMEGYRSAQKKAKKLYGTTFRFPYPSVGATENAVMAAVLASGTTKLVNCAKEPEVAELCGFLRSMGAKISGERTGIITVDGVEKLFPTNHVTAGDRICAGTYLAAAAASGGKIEITGVEPVILVEPLKALRKMGAGIRIFGAAGPKARICMAMEQRPAGIEIDTGPYPGFPTDLQSVFLAAEAAGSGESRFRETVYEARFEAAMRLAAFGADVSVQKDTAIIKGRYPLLPGIAETPDLRGGAALLVAALAADGLSVIADRGHLSRGYEDIGRDLRKLGADIEECEL